MRLRGAMRLRVGRQHLFLVLLLALLAFASAGPNDESGCPKLSSETEFDSFVQVLAPLLLFPECITVEERARSVRGPTLVDAACSSPTGLTRVEFALRRRTSTRERPSSCGSS